MNKQSNSLIDQSSTYLLQHAYNPVNWYPWAADALALSVKLDKPIMLSIGYSACHWCHVMEEESFQDEETAKIINAHFIPIKVDREERPDIDDIYMTAIQLMTGHGGWPLTVFLTPQLKPFYGGTYFPKEDKHHGQHILPGFKTILQAVNNSWQTQRNEIEANAKDVTSAITSHLERSNQNQVSSQTNIDEKTHNHLLNKIVSNLSNIFDPQWGGFGGAPKFPQTLALSLCLRAATSLKQKKDEHSSLLLEIVTKTLDNMSYGGIYDQLGGGFARYSTDEKWRVPHFEKMLYDNALLAEIYFKAFAATSRKHWQQIACETLDFMARELSHEGGGFYSSLDADSEGVEGQFYTWEKSEIKNILGPDSDMFCQFFNITETGNFEHGKNILYLNNDNAPKKIEMLKSKLFSQRTHRVHPGRDEKILVSWNGLAISAFVSGYQMTGEEKYLIDARQTANFILKNLIVNNRLHRSFAQGKARLFAYLDDYAFFCQALIDLSSVDSDPNWLKQALALTESMLEHFWDKNSDDFFYTANDHEQLIARPKNHYDGPIPSATSVAVFNLLKLAVFTNKELYRNIANDVLSKYKNSFAQFTTQYANMVIAWDFAYNEPSTLVIVTSGNKGLDKEMILAAHSDYSPNRVITLKDGTQDDIDKQCGIFQDKNLVDGRPTAYICQGYSCQAPINDIHTLKMALNHD